VELISVPREGSTPISGLDKVRDKRGLRLRFYSLLLAGDAIALILGFNIAGLLRFEQFADQQVWTLTVVLLPLFLVFDGWAHNPNVLISWRAGLTPAFGALLASVMIVLFLAFGLKASAELSRIFVATGTLLSGVLIACIRALVGVASRKAFQGAPMSRLLITDGVVLRAPPGVELLKADLLGLSAGATQPIVLDRLAQCLTGVDCVFVACRADRRQAWANALRGSGARVELLVPELDTLGALGQERFAGMTTTLLTTGPLRLRDEIAKRALDLAIVIPVLIFLAPMLALVSLAIKLDSPGPVLFVQQRVGQRNRLFSIFKFRSMYTALCDRAGDASTERDDKRITRVGRFIRATSMDELPQLLNILRGEMSFVGPRPHALGSLAGDKLYWQIDPRYSHRHACKPGLTGLAQIRGFRGATHRQEDLTNRLHADLEYVNGWSVVRDIAIMLATVKVVVHSNAF